MSEFDFKAFVSQKLQSNLEMYLQDFEAMSDDQLAKSPGGVARTPYDFTYEIASVNNRVAMRLRGEEPPKMDSQGWMTAPDDFKDRAKAVAALKDSVNTLKTSWENLPADKVHMDLQIPNWDGATPLSMTLMMASHMGYHCGQLNYIQTLNGDAEMHWM